MYTKPGTVIPSTKPPEQLLKQATSYTTADKLKAKRILATILNDLESSICTVSEVRTQINEP